MNVTVFSLNESNDEPDEIAQLQVESNSFVLLSGKRRDGLHLVARTNAVKFATKKSLQHCVALYPVILNI